MTVKELKDMLGRFPDDRNILTYNRTTHRWFKTGTPDNYAPFAVGEIKNRCGSKARKQLEVFDENDVTLVM